MTAVRQPDNWRWRDAERTGPAVVFDIDGVLSDAAGRLHHLESQPKNWDAFFQAAADDPVIEDVARLLDVIDHDAVIVLLTGRPTTIRGLTLAWLERFGLRWDLLVMRDIGNYEAAMRFKRRTLDELRAVGIDPRLAFEDDRRNVQMFRDAGVSCVYIHAQDAAE